MMRSTLYFSLAVLFVLVALSASAEEKPRKTDDAAVVESKKKPTPANRIAERERKRPEQEEEEEDDNENIEDGFPALTSYANNRYTPLDASEGNLRPRSRWQGSSSSGSLPPLTSPLLYDELSFENEGPRSGFGNERQRSGFGNVFQGPSSSSMSYQSNNRLSNGPVCHSLIDPQYTIFSDICGAVPQARYSLPNPVGHRERWQIAQVLNTITNASPDSACIRSLRLLLCPVLFPPCPTRYEPSPVLPCQSYCRAVKSRCAIPALDLIPCEALPPSSDICPTNQGYGSFLPPNPFSSMSQSFSSASGLPQSRQFPSLQSLLSSSGIPSGMNGPHPMLSPSQAALSAAQTVSSSNLYNNGPFNTETLSPMVSEYRQAPRYAPYTRSSPEVYTTNDMRGPAEGQYPTSARSPVVKA